MIGTKDVSFALVRVAVVNSRSISVKKISCIKILLTCASHDDHCCHVNGLEAYVDVEV